MEKVATYNPDSRVRISKNKPFTLRIVVPALNEEKNLGSLLFKLNTLGYFDVVVIDGKSNDRTIEIAKRYGAKVILQNGYGKGDAIKQLLNDNFMDVDALVMMDADGSMDPKEIPYFINSLKSGADIVKGSRFLEGGYTYDMTILRRIGNTIFVSLVNLLHSTKYSDLCYGFIAFNRRSVKLIAPLLKSQNFEIETEILLKAKMLGLKVKEIPSTEFERKNGKSNLKSFRDGIKIIQMIFQSYFS